MTAMHRIFAYLEESLFDSVEFFPPSLPRSAGCCATMKATRSDGRLRRLDVEPPPASSHENVDDA